MPAHPGPHHRRPTRPLTERELSTLADLERRLTATRSDLRIGRRCRRIAASLAGSLVVVVALVAAGALLGPAGIALGTAALITGILGMILRDLMRSGMQQHRPRQGG
jgi:hypothetical protein